MAKEDLEEEELDEEGESEEAAKEKPEKAKEIDKATKYALGKIKAYLEEQAGKDPLFAEKCDLSEKRLLECWSFICGTFRKSKRQFAQSDELYSLAFEFFNDEIKADGKGAFAAGKAMAENDAETEEMRKAAELTEKEKDALRSKALADFAKREAEELERKAKATEDKAKEKAKKEAERQKEKSKQEGGIQLSLF